MPKRQREESDDSRSDTKEPLSGTVSDSSNDEPVRKRARKSVNFEDVQVFYFNRTQGFVCVPSQGGTTLGMSDKHQSKEVYKLSEYLHRRKMLHRRRASVEASRCRMAADCADDDGTAEDDSLPDVGVSCDENSLSADRVDSKTNEEEGGECEVEGDNDDDEVSSNASILPVPVRRRRMLLRLSGVRKIDAGERAECQEIRQSREFCGCSCQVFCDPDTCECSQDGIQCQVDRMRFPCGCTREGCGNKAGRIEFNPARVRTHFVHTIMRLELEKQLADARSPTTSMAERSAESPQRRHIRFDDSGEPMQQQQQTAGEPLLFNSTGQGSCRECNQFVAGLQQVPPVSLPDADDPSCAAAVGRDDSMSMAACPWAATATSIPAYTDDLTIAVPATASQTCSSSSLVPSHPAPSAASQSQAAGSRSGGQVPQHAGRGVAWSSSTGCFVAPEPGPSQSCTDRLAGSAVAARDKLPTAAAPATDTAVLPSCSGAMAELLRHATGDSHPSEPAFTAAELRLFPATLQQQHDLTCLSCDPQCRCSPEALGCCSCATAVVPLAGSCRAVTAAELPASEELTTEPAMHQTLLNLRPPAESSVPHCSLHAVVDSSQQCDTESTFLPLSTAVSCLTPLTPFSGSSMGSNDLYLSFQLSTGEGLYTDTDPLLANFCHQGGYQAVASSHDSHVAASQELVPFADLIESVYETVSA